MSRPAVVLLDEPLGALDQQLRKEMQIELKRMQRDVGITFIYVTHDQEEALSMSDRIAVMWKGRLLQIGSPEEIYDAPATEFVASFGHLPRRGRTGRNSRIRRHSARTDVCWRRRPRRGMVDNRHRHGGGVSRPRMAIWDTARKRRTRLHDRAE